MARDITHLLGGNAQPRHRQLAAIRDVELALDAQHRTPDTWAFWNPLMADARKSPRFIELIERIGLPDFWRENGWSDF